MVDARSVCPAILGFDPQENIDAPRGDSKTRH